MACGLFIYVKINKECCTCLLYYSILIFYKLINIHLVHKTTASLADTAAPPGSSGVALLRVQQHVLAALRRDAVVRARVDQLMIIITFGTR